MGGFASAVVQDSQNRKAAKAARDAYGIASGRVEAGKKAALELYDPYVQLGREALSPLSGLALGRRFNPETGEYEDISQEERMELFEASPDYQFRFQEGQRALEASQAARGGLLSGRAIIESQALGQNLASSEYNTYLNRLSALAGMGQQAATNAAGVNTQAASQLAGHAIGAGQVQAQYYQQRGQLYGDATQQAFSQAGSFFAPGAGAGASAAAPTAALKTSGGGF